MGIEKGDIRSVQPAPVLDSLGAKPAGDSKLSAFVSDMLRDFNGLRTRQDYEAFFGTVGPLDPLALEIARKVIWASSWAYERKEGTVTKAVDLTESFCRQIVEVNLAIRKLLPAFDELYQREGLDAKRAEDIAENIMESALAPRTKQRVGPLLQPCFMGELAGYPTFPEFMQAYQRSGGLTEQVLMLSNVQAIPPRELEYVRKMEATGILHSFKHFVLMAHCAERLDSKLRRSRSFRRMEEAPRLKLWQRRGELLAMLNSYPGGGDFNRTQYASPRRRHKPVDSNAQGRVVRD